MRWHCISCDDGQAWRLDVDVSGNTEVQALPSVTVLCVLSFWPSNTNCHHMMRKLYDVRDIIEAARVIPVCLVQLYVFAIEAQCLFQEPGSTM